MQILCTCAGAGRVDVLEYQANDGFTDADDLKSRTVLSDTFQNRMKKPEIYRTGIDPDAHIDIQVDFGTDDDDNSNAPMHSQM
jgi:hypothetical protein